MVAAHGHRRPPLLESGRLSSRTNAWNLRVRTWVPPELGIELSSALRKLYPNEFDMRQMILLVNNRRAMDAIAVGTDPRNIADDWREELERFVEIRREYLLY